MIERAKSYSHSSGKSLSRIVADYFDLLTRPDEPEEAHEEPLPPITRALSGSLKGADAEASVEDHRRYLAGKYLA